MEGGASTPTMYSTRGLLLLALASVASFQTIQVPPSVVCVCLCVCVSLRACVLTCVPWAMLAR